MSICEFYCSHGGVCALEPGHDGQYDSGYCTWDDAEALSRSDADDLLREKPGGSEIVMIWDRIV
jgi:hypothetical protein